MEWNVNELGELKRSVAVKQRNRNNTEFERKEKKNNKTNAKSMSAVINIELLENNADDELLLLRKKRIDERTNGCGMLFTTYLHHTLTPSPIS